MMLEIAANSVASALAAQEGGAGRVELCTALELGGLTPSHALIALARERLRIPLVVLIRPRAGDFLYSELECETMQHDIETCGALGCDGVVLGVLDANGEVDMPRCRTLIAAAGTMGVTFHRAFDLARDPSSSLDDLIALGCERVLTSGAQASAVDGATLIRELVTQATGRLAVMPGAGITAQNIAALAAATGAREFHASAKSRQPSGMQHQRAVLSDMESGELRSDAGQVRAMATALATAAQRATRF
ncbi:copper homeostasis protein CutC [Rhodanobacter denitrificans]|uniref:copper homeostasis protein CutC n=1 Tax=Rhodanobacter denitrificans TaxID=666685 RepID=UPI001F28E50C|nr:copper homeostasis protein CutC [Rhodanobacter denitrificans]UJJ60371.1 copper homeostasis protein CutC [Rhodanobacter denitrificans]